MRKKSQLNELLHLMGNKRLRCYFDVFLVCTCFLSWGAWMIFSFCRVGCDIFLRFSRVIYEFHYCYILLKCLICLPIRYKSCCPCTICDILNPFFFVICAALLVPWPWGAPFVAWESRPKVRKLKTQFCLGLVRVMFVGFIRICTAFCFLFGWESNVILL